MGRPQLSDQELIDDLRRVYEELGRPPRTNDIREYGEHSYQSYYRRWGSIKDVLDAADIPHHNRVETGSGISEEDLIADLKRLGETLGRPPQSVDVAEHGKYAQPTYYNRFENFAEALEKAGFPSAPGNRIPEELLLEALQELADELGRSPTGMEMNEEGRYRASTYHRRFGSWDAALGAAKLETD